MKKTERERAQEMQSSSQWRHLWRGAGRYANVSIFGVESNEALNNVLSTLPLFPFMCVTVTPLCRHPSPVRADDS
ncbi:muconolactone Delta-isomerase family protein [Tardiphaga sp.]|uniref:muconolactone Delta-isomerase family protein n=1 Tax=Tardiphaga sp. TaxID=1926292 RepID=UPI002616BBF5|nr:muconolactone Delta-isomerase family protein [Tardiphaga sp.]